MGKALALVTLAVLASAPGWAAATITVTFPAWTKTVTAADLVTPSTAGSNVTGSYDNTGGIINITKVGPGKDWEVKGSRTLVPAPGDGLIFTFTRTSDGSKNTIDTVNYPSGVPKIITNSPIILFAGTKNSANITFTMTISNVVLTLPIGTHSTQITLSISEV